MADEEKCSSYAYVPMEAISFDELEALQKAADKGRLVDDLTWQYKQLLNNIIYSDEVNNRSAAITKLTTEYTKRLDTITDGQSIEKSAEPTEIHEKSPIKRENGIDFPAKDYAFVPNPALPSTWRLRLTETPGKITVAQLTRAATALGAANFKKAGVPATALSAVKRRIRAEYRKLGVAEESIPASIKKAFTVYKSTDGVWRWFAVYSNNFRDRDNPPEIISERSHKSFVAMCEKGVVPLPELWHWHIKGTRWGVAEVVGYDHGFAWAAGVVDAGHEKEAENLSKEDDLRVSHGMPSRFIKRLTEDPSIINLHVTSEISPLPGWAAANELTDFSTFEGIQAMTQAQKDYLKNTVGLGDEEIAALAGGLEAKEAAAIEDGFERKDTPENKAKPPVNGEEEEEEKKPAKKDVDSTVTAQTIADAIGSVVRPLIVQLKAMNERIGGLEAGLKEVEVFAGDQKSMTPVLSLEELVKQSVIGQPAAEVDGRSKLARSKPKEAAPNPVTPVNFINELIANE